MNLGSRCDVDDSTPPNERKIKMEKEIFAYIRMMRGINDYNQMVKDLMENFELTKSQAEDYIQRYTV